jgi:VWFA-related protein
LRFLSLQLLHIAIVCFAALGCVAQTPPVAPHPQPTPPTVEPQEQLKTFTEEVLVPVFAFDRNGRFDPTLVADDFLVFEDGVSQPITSLRRVESSVLLLLDTGGALNPAMSTNTTREIAIHLVSHLRAGDRMAAMQFGDRVEMIQNWTTEKDQTIGALKSNLSSGRHAYLTEALLSAATQLEAVPSGSRHVVLITDGVAAGDDRARLTEAITQLLTAHATVHVISYTSIGRKAIGARNPLVRVTMEKPKSATDVANALMHPEAVPESERRGRKVYLVLDTDFPMRNRNKKYAEATRESELWLASLADETGGVMLLPASTNEMIVQGETVAREIDSQYVLAYTPKRSLTSAAEGEYRSIKVLSLRGGPEIRSRRGYVAKPPRDN